VGAHEGEEGRVEVGVRGPVERASHARPEKGYDSVAARYSGRKLLEVCKSALDDLRGHMKVNLLFTWSLRDIH
jgi:hypothetical protein